MKLKKIRGALSILLIICMLTGQFMVVDALAADDVIITEDDNGSTIGTNGSTGNVIIGGTSELPAKDSQIIPSDVIITTDSNVVIGGVQNSEPEVRLMSDGEEPGDGGLTVTITSDQTQVSDGDKYTFTVSILDTKPTEEPNIKAGDILELKLPEFLTIENMQKVVQNCGERFDVVGYNADNHTLTLRFKAIPEGSSQISIGFAIEAEVDASNYDDDGQGTIEIGLGDTQQKEINVSLDTGIGTGSGDGETERESYLTKTIWRNRTSPGGGGNYYVLNDPNKPIGYTVSFGVSNSYNHNVQLVDSLSNGVLALCDSDGNIDSPLQNCVRLYLDGDAYFPNSSPSDSLIYNDTPLGTITLAKSGTGFAVTCSPDISNGEESRFVDLSIQYFARVVGNSNDITNSATLTVDGAEVGNAQSTILRYNSYATIISKYIKQDEALVKSIDIEDENELTFHLVITQYGSNPLLTEGIVVIYDILEDCFEFVNNSVELSENAAEVFEVALAHDDNGRQKINIIKQDNSPLQAGDYTVDFKVKVLPEKLKEGEASFNTIGDSKVIIRRKAKLTVNKMWTGGEEINKGAGARFTLLNGSTTIADSGNMHPDNSYTLRFRAQDLNPGRDEYTLHEEIDPTSGYAAAKDIKVTINRAPDDKVTIESINGVPYDTATGAAVTTVENTPDSGKGSLTFRKFGNKGEALIGGSYELYKVGDVGENDKLIKAFSTVNGEYTENDLDYGTYYVKEISAPPGYLIQGEGNSAQVVLSKTAPYREVSLVNDKFESGKITIKKQNEKGIALPGVTFTLTDGSNTVWQEVSGQDGIAEFSNLVAGVYTVTETMPTGYAGFSGPLFVTIDASSRVKTVESTTQAAVSGSEIIITWKNIQQFGALKVLKYKQGTTTPLSGAEFALYQNDEPVGDTKTTGEDGSVKFEHLPYGTYTLKELEPAPGYVVAENLENGVEVVIGSTDTVTYICYNDIRKGSITLTKQADGENGAALAGALFGLYSDAAAETLLRLEMTGEDGRAYFDDLEAGTYYIKEIQAPVGYRYDNTIHEVIVGGNEEDAVWECKLTAVNELKRYGLRILKTDESGSKPLEGAEFTIDNGNGIRKVGTSDEYGYVRFDSLPYGTYTLTETKAPNGYLPAAQRLVTIDDAATASLGEYDEGQVVVINDPVCNEHTKLTVCKFDDNGTTPLSSAKFRIKNSLGEYVIAESRDNGFVYRSAGIESEATVFTTDSSGTFVLEYIPVDNYTLEEIEAPSGYIIATDEKPFSIREASTSVSINNTQIKARLKLIKKDGNGKLLDGVSFVLRSSSGGYVTASGSNGSYEYTGLGNEGTWLTTDSRGELSLSGLLWGIYYLDEVATPAGLVPQNGIMVEVTAQQHNKTIPYNVENPIERGSFSFKKTDTEGNGLSGAVFQLTLVEGSGNSYSAVGPIYAVSDADGVVRFENLTYGVYRLTEYLAPANYSLSNDVRYVSIGGAKAEDITPNTAEELKKDWVNEPQQLEFTVRKVSAADNSKPLSGAVFEVLDKDLDYVASITVNNGVSDAIKLPVGEYYLKEITAPDNYILNDEPIPFKVTAHGKNEVVVKNAPFTGSLTVIKTDMQGNALAGAEFRIYDWDAFDALGERAPILYTAIVNSDGRATLTGIPFGSYAIKESRAPQGYELSEEVQKFTITNAAADEAENAGEQVEVSFKNEKTRFMLCITKVDIRTQNANMRILNDADSVKYLSGASFLIYGSGFYTTVTTQVTAENPTGSVFVEVPSAGTYYVTEIEAPTGYTLDPNTYPVDIIAPAGSELINAVPFRSMDYPTAVKLYKVDENGEVLEGAGFMLYGIGDDGETPIALNGEDGEYSYAGEGEGTLLTIPESGTISVYELPAGSYIFRETVVPGGYMSIGDVHFSVGSTSYDRPVELTAENILLRRGVAICKQDENGVRLAGASFALFAKDGTDPIATVTTTASGYAMFPQLTAGDYYIIETDAPENYNKTEEVFDFTINGDGIVTSEHEFVQISDNLEYPFFVLTAVNTPVQHSFQIKKVSAADNSKLLSGAVFRITGSGLSQDFTTNSDGLTNTISLPIGSYTLSEIKAPDGYMIDGVGKHIEVSADGVTIDGTEIEDGEAAVYVITNPPQEFRLRLLKQDRDTQQKLENVAFTIVAPDGTKHSLVTDASGYTEFLSLVPGTYAISETVAAVGYNPPLAGWSFTVVEGPVLQVTEVTNAKEHTFVDGVLTLVLENERVAGNLMIKKIDFEDSRPLANAEFELLDKNGNTVRFQQNNGIYTVSESETASTRLITNAMGEALLMNLPFGDYELREVKAPFGYALSANDSHIKLTVQSETLNVEIPNKVITRKVSILKRSAGEELQALIGAVFTLYAVEDGERVYVSEATTGYDGKVHFELPYGNYVIAETRAPDGYELSAEAPVEFTIDDSVTDGEELSYIFTNEKTRYSLEIYKYDQENESKGLNGAEFSVTNSKGYSKIVTTDENGRALLSDIEYDDYIIREIKAPVGYRLSTETYRVDKDELIHGKAVAVQVPNTYILGKVALSKVDHEDPSKQLEGAEFTLSDQSGNVLKWNVSGSTYTLDANGSTSVISAGSVLLDKLPEGQYTLTETKSPDGYVCLDEAHSFEITASNFESELEITIENLLRRTAIGIIKIDTVDNNLRLKGAEFTLYSLVNGMEGPVVATGVTNSNGLVTFTDLTMGTYRLKETKAPDGYKLWSNPVDFRVDALGIVTVSGSNTELPLQDSVYVAKMTNRALTKDVTIKKVSAETGDALSGATFRLTGDKTYDITTGKDGTAKLSLPYGSYILEEIIAPTGYVLKEEKMAIAVSDAGLSVNGKAQESLVVTVEDDPVKYGLIIHKQDANNGKSLSGAAFTISSDETYILTTNGAGNTELIYLAPGTYPLAEITTPNGYVRPLKGWTLAVSSSGKMTVEGTGAGIAYLGSISVLTLENSPQTPPPGGGVAKTGQTLNQAQLLCGAMLMLASSAALLWLISSGKKHDYDIAQ